MYNTFTHDQRKSQQQEIFRSKIKDSQWQKRYRAKIQPQLLEHYEKRISSFIHKLDENPIVVNPENLTAATKEKQDHFVFRNIEDWKSVLCSRERTENSKNLERLQEKFGSEGKCWSIQPSPIKEEYRTRQKDKQINPPMRYTYITKDKLYLEPIRKKRLSLRQIKQGCVKKQPCQRSANLHTTNQSASSSKYYPQDEDADFMRMDNKTESIEIEARKYEKQRQIIERKLHFKKLMDLSLTSPNELKRRDIKTILRKCGYLKNKKSFCYTQSSELDQFSSIVERIDKIK